MLALAVTAAAALASTAGAGSTAATSSQALSCNSTLKIAVVTPFTGGAGFLGNEQYSWAKYAADSLAPKYGLKVSLVKGDTPVEQGDAPAQTLAQKFVADQSVVAIIGPATSGAVAASSKIYLKAGLAHISQSATRTSLTKGAVAKREGTRAFYRVVPADDIQGPTDANFMIKKGAKNVVVVDFQEPYSQGLASQASATLRKKGVKVTRLSIANTVTDFSSFVTKVPDEANFVFFPTQKPADAQNFAQQLVEQGKKAKVFGSDGANNAEAFKVPGSYVSNFAPDISAIKSSKGVIAGWQKANPKAKLGSFGPPTYLATQVALKAIQAACKAGGGQTTRAGVLAQVKNVKVPVSVLGGSFAFQGRDPKGAKFYIFEIQKNGSYKLVG
jgi:branched-chain amino acid transport system substrate-binding protein